MTTKPKLTISYKDLDDGYVRTTLTICGPSNLRTREARLEQAERVWGMVLHSYGAKNDDSPVEIIPSEAVRH
ncbi:hypothetical protein AB870_09295 [Pandoraea faecigallinarum]|uniref:Uncharacterized protein n=1 Tax=Pandoraea faecigallinarum TaxID=656179 RepID=A0A0H3WRL4_9BURK|nr:hypothetical protein [Pandoraea faecigallinarum]AKM30255.1 hypothetical protein AB870_09295 [Pandoraea faecigallinarum]